MKLRLPNETVWALTGWMDSSWLARRIAREAFGSARDVRLSRLSRDRVRRVHLLEVDGRTCIVELSPRLRYLRTVVEATTTATRHGLRVARLLAKDVGVAGLLRHGTAWVLFEYVEGRHPSLDCPPAELEAIADAYGGLHAVRCERPGLGDLPGWTLGDHLTAWGRILARTGAARELGPWLDCHRPAEAPSYELVHGDANARNVFLDGGGNAVLIDLGEMRFGLAPFELVYLLLRYCNDDAIRRRRFLEAYRRRLGAGFETWERHGAFWLAGGFLERARWLLHAASKRRGANQDAARIRVAQGALASAARLAQAFPDGKGDLDRVLAHCRDDRSRAPAASSGTR